MLTPAFCAHFRKIKSQRLCETELKRLSLQAEEIIIQRRDILHLNSYQKY
jgi:hypothetical protein